MIIKFCIKCQSDKTPNSFYRDRSTKDGLSTYCKNCRSIDQKKHYNKNKELYKQKSQEYYQKNKEKIKKRNSDWRKNNPEKHQIQTETYRQKYPERRVGYNKTMYDVRSGKIDRPDKCSFCGKECVPEGHHKDYNRPTELIWLCVQCHTNIHNRGDVKD